MMNAKVTGRGMNKTETKSGRSKLWMTVKATRMKKLIFRKHQLIK